MANVSKATLIDQGIEFPLWATEETLQAVRSSLDKDYRADRSDNRIQTGAQQKTTRAIQVASTKSTEYYLRLLRTFGKMDGSFKSLSESILASGVKGGTGQVIATSLGALDNYVKIVRQLSDVGAGLNTRYVELVNSSAEAFMFIDEFANTIGENNLAIRNLGDSATDGFMQFSKLSRQLQLSTRQFGMYGMHQEELNGLLLEQIELERLGGASGRDVTERTAAAMEALISETSAMAEITGRSRREAMQAAQGAIAKIPVATYISQVRGREGDAAADREQGAIMHLSAAALNVFGKELGPKMADELVQAYVTGTVAQSPDLMALMSVVQDSGIQELLAGMRTGDKNKITDLLNNVGKQVQATAKQTDIVLLQNSAAHMLTAELAANTKAVNSTNVVQVKGYQQAELQAQEGKRFLMNAENMNRQLISDIAGAKQIATIVVAETGAELFNQLDDWLDGLLSSLPDTLTSGSSSIRQSFKNFATGGTYTGTQTADAMAMRQGYLDQKAAGTWHQGVGAASAFPPQATAGSPTGSGDDMWTGMFTSIDSNMNSINKTLNSIVDVVKQFTPGFITRMIDNIDTP